MIRLLPLTMLLLLLPFYEGIAAEVDVYTGEAVVADQGAGERRRALPLALEHVLTRYSGLRNMENIEDLDAVLQGASSILLTFYYRNVELEQADGGTLNELRLVAKFSPTDVDELARSLGMPLWQADRNALEIWVVVDDGRARQVMPLEVAYVKGRLNDTAEWRGQPLLWPKPDEEGMYPVDMQLLWGGYTEDLSGPSGIGVLILAARREGLEWSVRSNLGFGGQNWSFRIRDLDFDAAMTGGLQKAIDQVAFSSAIAASDLGAWRQQLTVGGIGNAADYQACLAYLQSVGIVSGVAVVSAQPATFIFELELSAMPQYLMDALTADGFLEPGDSDDHFIFQGEK